ncbi:MAG: hypothetical protein GJU76_05740 [Gallionella sp.]|nr:hypothetical protein [Gallionella sp.]
MDKKQCDQTSRYADWWAQGGALYPSWAESSAVFDIVGVAAGTRCQRVHMRGSGHKELLTDPMLEIATIRESMHTTIQRANLTSTSIIFITVLIMLTPLKTAITYWLCDNLMKPRRS